jgi:hypothetical protein
MNVRPTIPLPLTSLIIYAHTFFHLHISLQLYNNILFCQAQGMGKKAGNTEITGT